MTYIINWTSQIIVYILLAMMIDFLTPKDTLQKYIRFVVGLILILLFLQPVLQVFQIDLKSSMNRIFTQHIYSDEQYHSEIQLEKMIENEKKEIESTQHAYILEQMAVQLRELAEQPLREEFDVTIESIDFQFTNEQDFSYESLQEVIVYVTSHDKKQEGVVQDVSEVKIDTKEQKEKASFTHTDEMTDRLEEIWQITDKSIVIMWEG
ncbi:stage III sporulation protein AF [Cerasibacillus quisquiliarum]|uniref:Stage III sporulation protein AF n=1 Tax=Cerasibacillus quisquiliarum TaxID=227865 RepID=A0A511V090_9BACI|nr:stage III sporulation protein AF [Cerasibacillus quisquiliarum]MBB5145472.1 stage III sporulation protein AF [Cerasibacillus quisquiliarum]GEN31133.1 stage III sporulation protein AF [Cerasibacillus quisquiliarum]